MSILTLTYNHGQYVAQAIESILGQKTNFDFELVIGDDCSTDNTKDVIVDYQRRFPGVVKPIWRDHNIGANQNYADCYRKCKGKYIAVCEGDDYWTDPLKLQKQVDFLEDNPDYVLCYTDIQHFIEAEERYIDLLQPAMDTLDIGDLFVKNHVTTLTAVFRNGVLQIPEDFKDLSVGDWPLYVLLAQFGKIKRLPFISGVYRVHASNNFQANPYLEKKLKLTQATEFLDRHLQGQYQPLARKKLMDSYYVLSLLHLKMNRFDKASEFHKKLQLLDGHEWNLPAFRLWCSRLLYKFKNRIKA